MLWIGILFGIVGAIIINILTIQTIKLQAIQSATGLLYVNLVMILMGEMIFKYYFIRVFKKKLLVYTPCTIIYISWFSLFGPAILN